MKGLNTNQKILSLDGLRGVAALIVVVSHISNFIGFRPTGFGAGQVGVMIFFALSGFLMCYVTEGLELNATNIRNFFARRFSRVIPLFLCVVVFAYVSYGVEIFGAEIKLFRMSNWDTLVDHLLLLKGNGVLWTIPVELFFYALFPIFWAFNRINICVLIAVLLLVLDVQFLGPHFDQYVVDSKGAVLKFLILFTKVHYFLIGILAYFYVAKFDNKIVPYNLIFVMSAVCVFLSYPQIYQMLSGKKSTIWNDVPLMIFIFGLLVSTVKSELAHRLLGNSYFGYFGAISYSLYLTHMIVLGVAVRTIGPQNSISFVVIGLLFALSLAAFTHRFIEMPSQMILNRIFLKRSCKLRYER